MSSVWKTVEKLTLIVDDVESDLEGEKEGGDDGNTRNDVHLVDKILIGVGLGLDNLESAEGLSGADIDHDGGDDNTKVDKTTHREVANGSRHFIDRPDCLKKCFVKKMKEDLLIYNTVENNLETEEPQSHYISTIQQKLKSVSKAGDTLTIDIVYAFIRKYQVGTTPDMGAEEYKQLPYGCKILKKGLRLDFSQMPPKLICMIYTFLTKYYSKDSD